MLVVLLFYLHNYPPKASLRKFFHKLTPSTGRKDLGMPGMPFPDTQVKVVLGIPYAKKNVVILVVSVTGQVLLAGGSKYCICSTLLGEMIQFDDHIFQMVWFNHQLVHDDSFVMGLFVPGIQQIKRQLDVRLLQIVSEAFVCLM